MKRPAKLNTLNAVAEDIAQIKIDQDMTIGGLRKQFFAIMRKHGIKRGTKDGNSISLSNPEWIMARDFFSHWLCDQFRWIFVIGKAPKDLRHY